MSRGLIVTFCACEGGVGRSLAIANVAHLLHEGGARVVVCDLDLESPGIERYLVRTDEEKRACAEQPGFVELAAALAGDAPPPAPMSLVQAVSSAGHLFGLLSAGARMSEECVEKDAAVFDGYTERVRNLDRSGVLEGGRLVALLREDLTGAADYVLVDACTGVTGRGAFAIHDLADVVIVMTTATDSCLRGTRGVLAALQASGLRERRGGRELHLLPLAARIEVNAGPDDLNRFRQRFRSEFAGFVSRRAGDAEAYLREAEICYVPRYSFGERVVTRESESERHGALFGRYEFVAGMLKRFAEEQARSVRDDGVARRTGGQVFISYRRSDTRRAAENLRESLEAVFGADTVFLDTSDVPLGADWPGHLNAAVETAAAVLVLIGRGWLQAADEWGKRLIDRPEDWCRREVEVALATGTPIYPLLIDGAAMPPAAALPESIRELVARQALAFPADQWGKALGALTRSLEETLGRSRTRDPAAETDPWAAYRGYLRAVHSRLVSFFPEARDHALAEVYVDLRLDAAQAKKGLRPGDGDLEGLEGVPGARSSTLAELLELPSGRAWEVLGEPGSGKSTVARHLAFTLADCDADPETAIPVYLPIAALVGPGGRRAFHLAGAAMRQRHGDDVAALVERRLGEVAEGRREPGDPRSVYLLLDGFDEVAPEHREEAERELLGLSELPGVRLVVFSRTIGHRALGEPFRLAWLRPLEEQGRTDLLTGYIGADRACQLEAALGRSSELRVLAGNPLMLTLMARLFGPGGALPRGRTGLYEKSIELLLKTPYDHRAGRIRAPRDVARVLSVLALELQASEAASWSFGDLDDALWRSRRTHERVEDVLGRMWGGDHEAFLDAVARQTGILVPDPAVGEVWSFAHRQFREYFAASGLAAVEDKRGWREVVGQLDAESINRWSETLGMYCALTDRERAHEVLEALAATDPAATVKALGDVEGLGAGELFEFLWREVPCEIDDWQWSPESESRYRWDGEHLLRLVRTWLERGRWDRADAVETLLRLGDGEPTHRLAWRWFVLRDLQGEEFDEDAFFRACGRQRPDPREFRFERIPAGSFVMGSPESEEGRWGAEGPQHEVTVAAFELAPMAVTNAAYKEFDPNHEPRRWDGVSEAELGQLPVVEVDWWDASLYCASVGGRLPTEAEWEYACRSGETPPFSFGATIGTDQVNYDGNRPYGDAEPGEYRKRPVAVGSLPANGFGLHEMHGNVWEWCEDRWHDSYDGAPPTGAAWIEGESEYRVVRGGSWFDLAGYCRSASRSGFAPGNRGGGLGFRPARSCD